MTIVVHVHAHSQVSQRNEVGLIGSFNSTVLSDNAFSSQQHKRITMSREILKYNAAEDLLRIRLCAGNTYKTRCGVCYEKFTLSEKKRNKCICWFCEMTMRIKKSCMFVMLSNIRQTHLTDLLINLDVRLLSADWYNKMHLDLSELQPKPGILKAPSFTTHTCVVWDADLAIMTSSAVKKVRSEPIAMHISGVGEYTLYFLVKPNVDDSAIGIYIHAIGNCFPLHLGGTVISCDGNKTAEFCATQRDVITLSGNGRGIPAILTYQEIKEKTCATRNGSIVRFCVDITATYHMVS